MVVRSYTDIHQVELKNGKVYKTKYLRSEWLSSAEREKLRLESDGMIITSTCQGYDANKHTRIDRE